MDMHDLKVPSSDEYVRAFRALEDKITAKQRELLEAHHRAPARVISATRLAELVGYESYSAVNLHYGKLGAAIARELGYDLGKNVRVGILVEFVDPKYAANEHWLWVLRHPVVKALEDLGWVDRTSDLMYPDPTTVTLSSQEE